MCLRAALRLPCTLLFCLNTVTTITQYCVYAKVCSLSTVGQNGTFYLADIILMTEPRG